MNQSDSLLSIASQKIQVLQRIQHDDSLSQQFLMRIVADNQNRISQLQSAKDDFSRGDYIAITSTIVAILAIGYSIYYNRKQKRESTLFHLIAVVFEANESYKRGAVDVRNGEWSAEDKRNMEKVLCDSVLFAADYACKFYLKKKVCQADFNFHLRVHLLADFKNLLPRSASQFPYLEEYGKLFLRPIKSV